MQKEDPPRQAREMSRRSAIGLGGVARVPHGQWRTAQLHLITARSRMRAPVRWTIPRWLSAPPAVGLCTQRSGLAVMAVGFSQSPGSRVIAHVWP
jgi:hypothetical protein